MPFRNGKHHKKTRNNAVKSSKTGKEVPFKNTKGYWAFSFFQKAGKGGLTINEQQIKNRLYNSKFDPHKIPEMMNPSLSIEESLLKKKSTGIPLNSRENIILENYLSKEKKAVEYDKDLLLKHKLNATVTTLEGRIRKLFMVAAEQLKKGNEELVYYVYQKLSELTISSELLDEYSVILKDIKQIVSKLDTIKLQFTKFSSNMPPLNETGFKSLEPFQRDVINNIDRNKSSIVSAPTSAGKSIITSYLTIKKVKILVCVPTDILAWQMASMIGKHTNSDIPIVTRTFESDLELENLIQKARSSCALVGTPFELLNILLRLNDIKWDWLVMDEIHMMGREGFEDMEPICKLFNDIPFLALSATIGNIGDLHKWFKKIGHSEVEIIECTKRFINQQRFYYDEDKLNRLHPLSMIDIKHFEDETILNRDINVTPPDVWDLVMNLKKVLDMGELDPYVYFKSIERIELNHTFIYFKEILKFMIKVIKTDERHHITHILQKYIRINLEAKDIDLVDVAFKLKENDKLPAIFFQVDSYSCLQLVKEFSTNIKNREDAKFPDMRKQRLKQTTTNKHIGKKKDQLKLDQMGDKKLQKTMMKGTLERFDAVPTVALNEPHKDFIFNKNQHFTQYFIDEINKKLKQFFHMSGDEYHMIIDLLWRGVGVYCKGLPDPYLNIVQELACQGKLAIVLSDISLVFGVSMPFKTSGLVTRSDLVDTLDPMLYHQAAGRAGRRGLDKEGNVIFVGYSDKRIKELSTSKIPHVTGLDTLGYATRFAIKLAKTDKDKSRWARIKSNFLLDKISDDDANEFYEDIEHNITTGSWKFCESSDIHFNHLLWKLRYSEDCFRIAYLIKYIIKNFHRAVPTNETDQVNIATFLAHFFHVKEATDDIVRTNKYIDLVEQLDDLQLDIPKQIDYGIINSIKNNKLETFDNIEKTNELRDRLLSFGEFIRHVQHYFYYSEQVTITRVLGKLLTRIWWIYHSGSPIL